MIMNTDYIDYRFEVTFRPSFLPQSTITIAFSHGEARLVVDYGIKTYDRQKEQYTVRREMADKFFRRLEKLSNTEQPEMEQSDGRIIARFDGIDLQGTFIGSDKNKFSFASWSPTKNESPRDYGIAEVVFEIFDSLNLSQPLMEYVEQLSDYFD